MQRSIPWRMLPVLLLFLGGTGCEYLAPPHQSWTEARVLGRVVDGRTRAPVAGAKVTRVHGDLGDGGGFGDSDKGASRMVNQPMVAVTDRDGRFELDSVKTAYLLLESFPDYRVTLRVQARGYTMSQTVFTNVSWVGGDKKTEPRIETGDMPLWREGQAGPGADTE
ncbi:MAG: hypothetical protein J0L84_09625 [Verrucomicrobia bacterium]|nr:hypothetical protein [Verrucomicrobiota bacterium]